MIVGDIGDLSLRARRASRRTADSGLTGAYGDRRVGSFLVRGSIDPAVCSEILLVACLVSVWLLAGFTFEHPSFASTGSESVVEVIRLTSVLARLCAAGALFFLPSLTRHVRLRWVSGGFVILSIGQLGIGTLHPALGGHLNTSQLSYASAVAWIAAGGFIVRGLLPRAQSQALFRTLLPFVIVLATVIVVLVLVPAKISDVTDSLRLHATAMVRIPSTSIFSGWSRSLAFTPAALTFLTSFAIAIRRPAIAPRGWLAAALTMLAGAQLFNEMSSSKYSFVFMNTGLLFLVGSFFIERSGASELRRLASGREQTTQGVQNNEARLSELLRLRADFTSMVAHEIGSPLAAIRAYIDILDLGYDDPALKEQAIATIRSQTDHLRNLARDVATIATIENDQFEVSPFAVPLSLLLAESTAFAASLPGDHPFICPMESDDRVLADPERIIQVLGNLLSNAAKYSAPGTPIELRAQKTDKHIQIEVIDRGFGIASEDFGRIFEKFGRCGTVCSHPIAGSGLGLYISRCIVEAHGSQLTVSSAVGIGSVFGFAIEVVE